MLPGILWAYFSITFFTSPRAPITTGTVMAFILHTHSNSISKSLYLASFSIIFNEEFLSFGMVRSMSRQLFSFLPLMTMAALLALVSQPLCIGMSRKIMMSSPSVTVWGSCSYHFSFVLTSNSLQNVRRPVCGGPVVST